jgi:hypothetical protein
MPAGQPLKFKSVEELQKKIDAYFKRCKEEKEPYTITGLAISLGTNRQTLINYEKKEEYFDTIKAAKSRVENYAEIQLFKANPTGPIFALKNFGWSDKREHEHTGADGGPIKQDVTVTFIDSIKSKPEV